MGPFLKSVKQKLFTKNPVVQRAFSKAAPIVQKISNKLGTASGILGTVSKKGQQFLNNPLVTGLASSNPVTSQLLNLARTANAGVGSLGQIAGSVSHTTDIGSMNRPNDFIQRAKGTASVLKSNGVPLPSIPLASVAFK